MDTKIGTNQNIHCMSMTCLIHCSTSLVSLGGAVYNIAPCGPLEIRPWLDHDEPNCIARLVLSRYLQLCPERKEKLLGGSTLRR